jgi:triosephosphate isomerase (TIM)
LQFILIAGKHLGMIRRTKTEQTKKLIAGNWKMNGSAASARTLSVDVAKGLTDALNERCDFLLCPPFVHLGLVRDTIEKNSDDIMLGAQDCAATPNGAYTGNISAEMLADMGCRYVILGHSERRNYQKETSEEVAAKALRAHGAGLKTIICVGEKEKERETGHEMDVVSGQLELSLPETATGANTVIAYEPVWAIGTGKTATPEDIRLMHKFIREKLQERLEDSSQLRILYGGSVKPENAGEIFAIPDVNGALIGGASLDAKQFLDIARSA